jgi:hypothetical protein
LSIMKSRSRLVGNQAIGGKTAEEDGITVEWVRICKKSIMASKKLRR